MKKEKPEPKEEDKLILDSSMKALKIINGINERGVAQAVKKGSRYGVFSLVSIILVIVLSFGIYMGIVNPSLRGKEYFADSLPNNVGGNPIDLEDVNSGLVNGGKDDLILERFNHSYYSYSAYIELFPFAPLIDLPQKDTVNQAYEKIDVVIGNGQFYLSSRNFIYQDHVPDDADIEEAYKYNLDQLRIYLRSYELERKYYNYDIEKKFFNYSMQIGDTKVYYKIDDVTSVFITYTAEYIVNGFIYTVNVETNVYNDHFEMYLRHLLLGEEVLYT